MNTILKRFVALAISLTKSDFDRAALRLTGSYVFGLAIVLFVSSLAVYLLAVDFIPLSPQGVETPHAEFSRYEFREHLVGVMFLVDSAVLIIAMFVAYWFARRTLRPIEQNYLQQQRFVSDVAHELRTPLAVIKAGTEVMLLRERSGNEYHTFMQDLDEETDRLTRLTNDLLGTLKNTDKKDTPKFSSVNLSQLVSKQVQVFAVYAQKLAVTIEAEIEADTLVLGPSDDLIRVIQNLLKNAIDYNRPPGSVRVTVAQAGKMVRCVITDTGIGIAPPDQVKIFDRFYKVDRARTTHGSGLGLAIVKEIILKHKGTITVTSALNVGSTFTLELPSAS